MHASRSPSSGQEAMTFQLYVDGLLGIADMWTKNVDETEYAVFIHKVHYRVAYACSRHMQPQRIVSNTLGFCTAIPLASVCAGVPSSDEASHQDTRHVGPRVQAASTSHWFEEAALLSVTSLKEALATCRSSCRSSCRRSSCWQRSRASSRASSCVSSCVSRRAGSGTTSRASRW